MNGIDNVCRSPDRLLFYLQGDLDLAETTAIESHLDHCPTCRDHIEAVAATPEVWFDARRYLTFDDLIYRTNAIDDFVVADSPQETPSPLSRQVQRVITSLQPSDDPRMLGRIDDYEVSGVIGAGGMGVVLKAYDRSLDRIVAIKVMAPHLADSGAARNRFEREARATAAVLHPNVIAIHGVHAESSQPYLVMPYNRGQSLRKRIDQRGPLPVQDVLRIATQIAAGLSAAHARGLVHRDIKPANILLEDGVERVTITDFGLARAVDDATVTRSGVVAGTPQYMSPEQARGDSIDQRSDLFSLGSVLYAMCTGRAPFRADTSYGIMRRIIDDQPRPVRELNPDIPQWLCRVIEKLLEKDADNRFDSAQQVTQLLEECLAHVQQPMASPLPASLVAGLNGSNSNRLRWTIVGTILIVLGAGWMGLMLWNATEPPNIAGKWSGEGWELVSLEKLNPESYTGTYRDTYGAGVGKIKLKWSRIERRFNGMWNEGEDRFGKLSIRLTGEEIRGAWTTSRDSKINPGTPELADLVWTRQPNAVNYLPYRDWVVEAFENDNSINTNQNDRYRRNLYQWLKKEVSDPPPNPTSDRAAAIRRLMLDLTGLPPTPEFVQQFEAEIKRLSREKNESTVMDPVDAALAWLDAARYGHVKLPDYSSTRHIHSHFFAVPVFTELQRHLLDAEKIGGYLSVDGDALLTKDGTLNLRSNILSEIRKALNALESRMNKSSQKLLVYVKFPGTMEGSGPEQLQEQAGQLFVRMARETGFAQSKFYCDFSYDSKSGWKNLPGVKQDLDEPMAEVAGVRYWPFRTALSEHLHRNLFPSFKNMNVDCLVEVVDPMKVYSGKPGAARLIDAEAIKQIERSLQQTSFQARRKAKLLVHVQASTAIKDPELIEWLAKDELVEMLYRVGFKHVLLAVTDGKTQRQFVCKRPASAAGINPALQAALEGLEVPPTVALVFERGVRSESTLTQVIDEMQGEGYPILWQDVDRTAALAKKYGSLPAVVILKDNREFAHSFGFKEPERLRRFVELELKDYVFNRQYRAWQQTNPYTPPSFDKFFPDDLEGGQALDRLWKARDRDSRPDGEILKTVRHGLRHTNQHRTSILQWIGNKYIWNQSPQHPDAIEIMYHAADFSDDQADPYGTQHYAVYFGLSVTEPKTPAILRTLAGLAIRVDDPNDLHRIYWGCQNQQQDLLRYLKPFLESDDKQVLAKAIICQKIFTGKLNAFEWAKDRVKSRAQRKFTDQLPQIRETLATGSSQQRAEVLELIGQESLTLIMDDSFLEAFAKCAKDEDAENRRSVAILVGQRWVWETRHQREAAIKLMLQLSFDNIREVRYNSVYYGLSTVVDKSDAVIDRLLEIAFKDREWNMFNRIQWGLRNEKQRVAKRLERYIGGSNELHAKAATEIYEKLVGKKQNETSSL